MTIYIFSKSSLSIIFTNIKYETTFSLLFELIIITNKFTQLIYTHLLIPYPKLSVDF